MFDRSIDRLLSVCPSIRRSLFLWSDLKKDRLYLPVALICSALIWQRTIHLIVVMQAATPEFYYFDIIWNNHVRMCCNEFINASAVCCGWWEGIYGSACLNYRHDIETNPNSILWWLWYEKGKLWCFKIVSLYSRECIQENSLHFDKINK